MHLHCGQMGSSAGFAAASHSSQLSHCVIAIPEGCLLFLTHPFQETASQPNVKRGVKEGNEGAVAHLQQACSMQHARVRQRSAAAVLGGRSGKGGRDKHCTCQHAAGRGEAAFSEEGGEEAAWCWQM